MSQQNPPSPTASRNRLSLLLWRSALFAGLLLLWEACARGNGERLLPTPGHVVSAFVGLAGRADSWADLLRTLARGAAGLVLGGLSGLAAGVFCGRRPRLHDTFSPLVTLVQSCPPIVWISLLLVWLSLGGGVPLVVSCISVFPVIFIQTANAVRGLDARWFEVARVYRVSSLRQLRLLILPGISHALAGAFSYAFGIAWKVTATAEFFGAQDGVGARIYQSYRALELEQLFAWTLAVALLGVAIEALLIKRIRKS